MLRVADLAYELPEGLIATAPAQPRESARLMVLRRSEAGFVRHATVGDLPSFLEAGDALIVNDTRVLPARLTGARSDTGGRVEGLFLGTVGGRASCWRIMLKAKRPRVGSRVDLTDHHGVDAGVRLHLLERAPVDGAVDARAASSEAGAQADDSAWIVRVERDGAEVGSATEVLERVGSTPLPPYIRQSRKRQGDATPDERDRSLYQTVFAGTDEAHAGSVAAPTAGLHFTPGLLAQIEAKGVSRHAVTLHVGTGTFKPVETEYVEQHPMHAEWCSVPASTARALEGAGARSGGRVIAVGTTACRTIESFGPAQRARALAEGLALEHWTRLLLTPGATFHTTQGLLTNFHLPGSTLMALVSALLHEPGREGSGVARLLEAYGRAVSMGYRFYSYGDAMLILP